MGAFPFRHSKREWEGEWWAHFPSVMRNESGRGRMESLRGWRLWSTLFIVDVVVDVVVDVLNIHTQLLDEIE